MLDDLAQHNTLNISLLSVFIIGLALDQFWPIWGQWFTNGAVWLIFGGLLLQVAPQVRLSLLICVLYATAGELFLSLVWGLYEYRLHNLPLFVPPGHALLFCVGIWLAAKLPASITVLVPLCAAPFVLFLVISGIGTLDGVLFLMLLACIYFGSAKKLYATMFIIALLLEICGTAFGNWRWTTQETWFGLTSINPPLVAGAFYCVLDVLVVWTVKQWCMLKLAQCAYVEKVCQKTGTLQ